MSGIPIISLLSMFFWLFPAVRQYRSQLFWYFFVLAFFEPASYLVYFITGYYQLKIMFALLLLYSVLFSFLKRRIFIYILPFFFLILIFDRFILTLPGYYYVAASQLVIFFLFFKRTIIFVANSGRLNIFHLFLLLESISLIAKIFLFLFDVKAGLTLYHITTIFQMLIAVFFSVYREDNKKLLIELRNKQNFKTE